MYLWLLDVYMRENNTPVEIGDKVKLNYNGKGPDPVFTVNAVVDGREIRLSNGATCYPQDFEAGRMKTVN